MCTSPAGTSRPISGSRAMIERRGCAICSPSWPSESRSGCCCGQGRRRGLFTPARAAVRPGARGADPRDRGCGACLIPHERPMHCHHEKLVIVDGEIAFVGGIDLTSLGGDRFDTQRSSDAQPPRMARRLQPRYRGPAVARRGRRTSPRAGAKRPASGLEGAPPPAACRRGSELPGGTDRPGGRSTSFLPQGDFRVLEAYTRALRSARKSRLSREPVPVVRRRWSRSLPASFASRRAMTFASSCCCPQGRTTAPTRDAGSWGCLARQRRHWRRALSRDDDLLAQRRAQWAPSTCTPRSGSSTTPG